MAFKNFVKQEFQSKSIPVKKGDIKYIEQLFTTVAAAQLTLKEFPELKNEVPLTIVDKEELHHD